MQKKIIILALAAAFSAPAFADTTVYGVVDAAVANISGTGVKGGTEMVSSGLAGSRLGVKASEDIGNGMKASIVLEYKLDNTKDAPIGTSRQQIVVLSGDLGTVAAGFMQTTGYDFSRFDPISGSLITPLGNLTGHVFMVGNNASLKRLPKALSYTSPNFSGFNIVVNHSLDTAGGSGDVNVADASTATTGTATMASVNYSAGPLAAALVYATNTAAAAVGTGAKTTETALGASYDLEMAKLFATYQTNKVDSNTDSDRVMSISASAPVTAAGTAVLTYAKATLTAQGTDKDASGMTVAWLQGLSKTTTFYAAYSTMSQGTASTQYSVAGNALSNIKAGEGSRMIAFGLNKKF